MELFLDALLDALIDGVKMLPFLYLAGHHARHGAGCLYRHQ